MTFSIVAVDRESKEVGFAIASCSWDAGQVAFARAELGAIASQAKGNLDFLGRYFELLPGADNGEEVLKAFRAQDDEFETRQVGLAALTHAPVAFTGSQCSPWAGHTTGLDYACQGNILAGPQVIEAMASTFEKTEGSLFERLFAALHAGDQAGGDLRGKQSARLCVMKRGWGQPGTNTQIDLAIPDHDDPIAEMGRVLGVRGHLVTIFGLLGEAASAEGTACVEALDRLAEFLSGKLEPRYLDWWETLADRYFAQGAIEKAEQAYRTYLGINPALKTVLAADATNGSFPEELARRLKLLE